MNWEEWNRCSECACEKRSVTEYCCSRNAELMPVNCRQEIFGDLTDTLASPVSSARYLAHMDDNCAIVCA